MTDHVKTLDENERLRAKLYGPEPEQPKMVSGVFTASENEEPFKDNPILQARRRAFDHPTQVNLCNLTDVVHRETSKLRDEHVRALRVRIKELEREIDKRDRIVVDYVSGEKR